MGLFRQRGHRFRASPLSLAVPLEGSEHVVGLRELQRRKDGIDLARALNLDSLDGSKKTKRSWRKRYKGPFLKNLTLANLRAEPKEWRKFAWGHSWHTYNVPESLDHLCERAEENFVTHLPNYLRFFLLLLLVALCLRPWSLLGAAALAGFMAFKMTFAAPLELRQLPFRQRFWVMVEKQYQQAQDILLVQQGDSSQQLQQHRENPGQGTHPSKAAAQAVLQLLCYVLLIYCNTIGRSLRALVWSLWLLGGHTALRRSASEYQQALQNPSIAMLRVEANSLHPAVPGYAFLQVLGFHVRENDDPRRVFREAWELASGIAAAAGVYCWHAAQFYSYQFWSHMRSYLPSFMHL